MRDTLFRMGEPFKEWIDPTSVQRLATQLHAAHPPFDPPRFLQAALPALPDLELKARVRHVATAIRAALPVPWDEALPILLAGAGPPLTGTDAVAANAYLWPLLQVVEEHGLEQPVPSLATLRELTRRFTAEFAVRPYLDKHPDVAWPIVTAWTEDPDVHVRRLASEGTRPRLPWASHLKGAIPRGLAVIERLRDDPERYVQRSVANHLNDISREAPAQALATARQWANGASPQRRWVIRHALRTRLKAGDPDALAIVGFGPPQVSVSGLARSSDTIPIGGAVTISGTITAKVDQKLRADVAVSLKRKTGHGLKVFRAGQRTLCAGQAWTWHYTLSMRPVTTRRYYPGPHAVTLRINGKEFGTVRFTLMA